jgi:hypothetical protein
MRECGWAPTTLANTCTPDPHWLLAARMLPKWRSWSAPGASGVEARFTTFRHSRSRTVPSTLTPPWRTLSRGSMRRWRICWFTVGLPSTAFTLHVAVTWNARSVRMRPNGSPNNDRQYWFQRARNVPGGNEVLVLLTNGLDHGCASDAGGCRVSPVRRTAGSLHFARKKLWRNGRQRAAVAVKCATAPEGWRRSTVSPASVSQRRSSSTVPPAPKTPTRRKARIARS